MAKKNGKMIALSIACGLGILLGGGALIRQVSSEKTKELPSYSYTIGAVTNEGALDKDDKSSITSEKLAVKDLVSIELAEDAKAKVYVHWYNEDGDWISTSEVTDETPEAPEGAETFRVEIEPTDDDDGEVGAFEKGEYAKLVTVTLKK